MQEHIFLVSLSCSLRKQSFRKMHLKFMIIFTSCCHIQVGFFLKFQQVSLPHVELCIPGLMNLRWDWLSDPLPDSLGKKANLQPSIKRNLRENFPELRCKRWHNYFWSFWHFSTVFSHVQFVMKLRWFSVPLMMGGLCSALKVLFYVVFALDVFP